MTETFVPQVRFVYECWNCGGEFYSRRSAGTIAFCPICHCEMRLVYEQEPPIEKKHPLSLERFEARK